jgi:hypothetical protein
VKKRMNMGGLCVERLFDRGWGERRGLSSVAGAVRASARAFGAAKGGGKLFIEKQQIEYR